jgi:lipoprotein-anchoring transpeptidase ErfK/SrfK
MGCPRLLNEHVEELYDLVVRSTPVTIVERWEPETIGDRAG